MLIFQLLHGKVKILDLTETDEISNDGLKAIANRCKLLMKLDLNMTKGNRLLVTDEGVLNFRIISRKYTCTGM